MADPVVLSNATDSWVNQGQPTKNYSQTGRLHVGTISGNARHSLIFFGKPWPARAKILSAKLRVFNGNLWSGSHTLSVQRINDKFSFSRVTWDKRPGVAGTAVAVTKSNAAIGTTWEFDVTTMIQSVSDGAPYYGFRLTSNATSPSWLYSAQAPQRTLNRRPQLEVTWSDTPEPPEDLSPAGGRAVSSAKPVLTFDFTDVSGSTQLVAAHVQINTSEDFTTTTYDSGEVALSEPEFDLGVLAPVWGGVTDGQTVWWRVKVKDGAGLWSEWSQPAKFFRQTKGTFQLLNPSSAAPVFNEVTPPIIWSLTGRNQRAYQVALSDTDDPGNWIWTSGKVTSTDQSITIPTKVLKKTANTYNLQVRVWDTTDRESTPGDPVYYEIVRQVTFQKTTNVTPVATLTGLQDYPWPWMKLTWTRATAPDHFIVIRDLDVIEWEIDPAEVMVSAGIYEWRDRSTPPRVNHTWEIVAVVNGESSSNNAEFVGKTQPNTTWIMEPDGSNPVAIYKLKGSSAVNPELTSMQTIHEPLGGDSPVLISQYLRGYQGRVTGRIASHMIPGLNAREMRNILKRWARSPGEPLLLFHVDETMEIVMYDFTYRPTAKSGGEIVYDIDFAFFEDPT